MRPSNVVDFWVQAGPKAWFSKNDQFDAEITERFSALHHSAARRELDDWAHSAHGALALLLLLDQFPRNMFRGSAHAFATDPLARHFARAAVEAGFDRVVDPSLRNFFYLPFEHSEDLADQDRCVALCADSSASDRHWSMLHRDIFNGLAAFRTAMPNWAVRAPSRRKLSCGQAGLRASHAWWDRVLLLSGGAMTAAF